MPEPHDTFGREDPVSVIEQQAADWLVLHDQGLSQEKQREFNRWLQADRRHAAIYAELAETWKLLGRVSDPTPVAHPASQAPASRALWQNPYAWLATAACVTAAFVFNQSHPAAADFVMTASTEVGTFRKVSLPDGSTVRLNTDTAITVQFTAKERHVALIHGEAHFQVAKNPDRPFIVNTAAINVRAVGTAFDVRRRPEAVEVLVTEGKVRVDDSIQGYSRLPGAANDHEPHDFLIAGEHAFIPLQGTHASTRVKTVAPAEVSQALAWQSQQLKFVATPLAEMVGEFNRYNKRRLVIADPRLAERRFGGTFPAGDYEEFVHLLESDFGIVAERDENEIRLKLAPSQ